MNRRPDTRTGRRRSHKKSRAGCAQCKRRHVKCDETRPECASCIAAGLECPFLSDANRFPTTTRHIDSAPTTTQHSPINSNDGADPDVNMVHLQLFNHFVTETSQTFVKTDESLKLFLRNILGCAFAHPYLMHELLSFAAVHLSIRNPDQSGSFRNLATSLQAKALAGLDQAIKTINETNCLALLFFSHVVGVHAFCDVFVSQNDSFGTFLDGLLHAIHLLRGVQAVILPWWQVLLDTEMGEFMREGEAKRLERQKVDTVVPHLHDLLASADISTASQLIYQEALRRLDVALQDFDDRDQPRDDINIVFAWLVTSPREYTDLLAERRPEALVLLAYYSVVLHRRRNSWIIGEAGRRMFTWINSYLGQRWAHWLTWPSDQIFGSTETANPVVLPNL